MLCIRTLAIISAAGILVLGAPAQAIERCKLIAGYLLDPEGEPEFAISVYRCVNFWKLDFEKFRGRSASGEARWDSIDSVQILDLSSDEVVVSQTCRVSDSEDQGVVAIAEKTENLEYSRIRAAWRADKARALWVPLDPDSVSCWNESAGFS